MAWRELAALGEGAGRRECRTFPANVASFGAAARRSGVHSRDAAQRQSEAPGADRAPIEISSLKLTGDHIAAREAAGGAHSPPLSDQQHGGAGRGEEGLEIAVPARSCVLTFGAPPRKIAARISRLEARPQAIGQVEKASRSRA